MDTTLRQSEFLDLIHTCNFEMLSYIKKICSENNIPFYLWGGTLLGAIRHQGFIPWDDDVDIVIFKKDFAQLKRAILESPDDRFELVDNFESEQFNDYIPMLLYKNSRLRSDNPNDFTVNTLHLDIFVLNNTSDQKALRILHGGLLKIIYGLSMAHRPVSQLSNRFHYSLLQKIAARSLSIAGKMVPLKLLRKLHHKVAQMFDRYETSYVFCTNNAPTCLGEKHSHPLAVYSKTLWSPFEKGEMPIPSGYDVILTSGYSNYMQLPPVEKRTPDHLIIKQAVINGYRCEDNSNE